MPNYANEDVSKKTFTSLENFLEWVSEKAKEYRVPFSQFFSEKGITGTLRIVHETKRSYSWSNPPTTGEHTQSWAQYMLTPLPGCCGVVVSHNSWIHDWYRGKGLGQWFHQQRLTLMKVLGYSCAMATVTSDNEAEIHILKKNGWKIVHSFVNSRTNHTVQIWVKDL